MNFLCEKMRSQLGSEIFSHLFLCHICFLVLWLMTVESKNLGVCKNAIHGAQVKHVWQITETAVKRQSGMIKRATRSWCYDRMRGPCFLLDE